MTAHQPISHGDVVRAVQCVTRCEVAVGVRPRRLRRFLVLAGFGAITSGALIGLGLGDLLPVVTR